MNVETSDAKASGDIDSSISPQSLRTASLPKIQTKIIEGREESNVRSSERIEYHENQPGLRVGDSKFRYFHARDITFGDYSTKLYLPLESRVSIDSSPAVVASFHGLNATISHAGSGLSFINDLVSKHGIYAETIDQPGCGNNLDFSAFNSLDLILDFYSSYLKDFKSRAMGKPLIVAGFCYSSGFLVEVNRRNPGLIDGMVLSGYIIPDRDIGLDFSIGVESKMYKEGLIKENPAVRCRADRIYADLPSLRGSNPFAEVQTLILIGQKDPFMTDAARDLFRKWAAESSQTVKFIEVEGGGHGVLGPIQGFPQSSELVRQNVIALIERVRSN